MRDGSISLWFLNVASNRFLAVNMGGKAGFQLIVPVLSQISWSGQTSPARAPKKKPLSPRYDRLPPHQPLLVVQGFGQSLDHTGLVG